MGLLVLPTLGVRGTDPTGTHSTIKEFFPFQIGTKRIFFPEEMNRLPLQDRFFQDRNA